jgi:hypothetical protein
MSLIQENMVFQNVNTTQGPFWLSGGKYFLTINGTFVAASRVGIEKQCLTSGVFVQLHVPLRVNGAIAFEAPLGQYRLAIISSTAVNAEIARIPME